MTAIITKAEAKQRGLKRYFTGKPCGRGHVAERWVSYPACVVCSKLKNAQWKSDNPIKVKQSRRATHLKHREKDIVVGREWYRNNKEIHRANCKSWAQRHPEKMREYSRKYFRNNAEKEKARRDRLYYEGPLKPTGERQWVSKNLSQMRTVKRLIKSLRRGRSPSQSVASTMLRLLQR